MFNDFLEFKTMLGTKICVRRYDIITVEENQGKAILTTNRFSTHIDHSYDDTISIVGIKVNNGDQDN